jgi:NO-binding membrane sensor protein with MHYT domain
MTHVHNFSYGLLNPGLAYLVSCLGCFLGLQCTARARAHQGASRARWLVLGALSIGTAGIWVMHFIAMLGFTIPGQTITYNIFYTIASMLISVAVVTIGLFIVGFGSDGLRPLLLGGTIIGIGVALMHYMGMFAMRMPDTMSYNPGLVLLSVVIAIVAGTAALWAALRMRGRLLVTLGATLVMGVAVSGMHYTGMAALRIFPAVDGGMASMGSGVSGTSLLVPLILGISILAFLVTIVVSLAPSEAEVREEAELMERINRLSKNLGSRAQSLTSQRTLTSQLTGPAARSPGTATWVRCRAAWPAGQVHTAPAAGGLARGLAAAGAGPAPR